MHAAIENCFPRRDDGNERKLWRLDKLNGKFYLLLLSPERPDFKDFASQFSLRDVLGETKDYEPLLARIENGQTWQFCLRANAARSVAEVKGERGKIHAHVTTEYQSEWLLKRTLQHGFLLKDDDFSVVQSGSVKFHRSGRKDAPVTIGIAVYTGVLTVSDSSLFCKTLTKGIGRAKAYGCGLLTVARPL
jgi:CRISPR system Cascade subunit CasE